MKKRSISIAAILILLGLLIVINVVTFFPRNDSHESESQPITQKEFPLQDFELSNLEGDLVRLSDFRGRPVVLNFWATWCPPCREEMPLLAEISEEYDEELVVLGVNSMETTQEVGSFITDSGLSFPVVIDADGLVGQQYLIQGLPTTLFIDSEGVLQIRHVGLLNRQVLDDYLSELGVIE